CRAAGDDYHADQAGPGSDETRGQAVTSSRPENASEEDDGAEKTVGHRPPVAHATMSKLTGSKKATQFTESVIREMTRLHQLHGGVNLSQGFPDFPAPALVKEAACAAIAADFNQYAVTWGARPLREAVAREFTRRYGLDVVADEQ